ncbi:uncharacterized protein LOC129002978 isoform X2 [Macrosteles quadrilineatus]|nr:uncharacterized protein LOC129002978 isoform X2 [Macrosteles quadrilineatus]
MEYPSPLSSLFKNMSVAMETESEQESDNDGNKWNTTVLEGYKSRGIYLSLQSILDYLRQPEYLSTPAMKEILKKYKRALNTVGGKQLTDFLPGPRRRFIVIEGLYTSKRSNVAQLVSRSLHAKYILNPYGKLAGVSKLPATYSTRRAYYCLTKYAVANVAAKMLRDDPVVMERYWLDQITFAIAKTFKSELPPLDSGLYDWPKDLLKPDLTFFINADNKSLDGLYQPNEINNFTLNLLQVYDYFKMKIPMVEISSNQSLLAMVKEVVGHVRSLGPEIVEEKRRKAARPLD